MPADTGGRWRWRTGSIKKMSPTLTIIAVIAGAQHCCSTVPRHWRQSQPGCGWNLAMKGGALPMRSTWQGQGGGCGGQGQDGGGCDGTEGKRRKRLRRRKAAAGAKWGAAPCRAGGRGSPGRGETGAPPCAGACPRWLGHLPAEGPGSREPAELVASAGAAACCWSSLRSSTRRFGLRQPSMGCPQTERGLRLGPLAAFFVIISNSRA